MKPDYPLQTDRLDLRPFQPGDLAVLHTYLSRGDVNRYLYTEPTINEESTRIALETRRGRIELRESGDVLQLAIVVRQTGQLVGDVLLMWRSAEYRQGEIGYVLHPDHQGKGYATEASREMLRLGFARLGLHRIYARLDGRNTASARVLERLGMRREAHLRENEYVKGAWTDEVIYALLAREWRAGD